ncbi:MaoC family dehydratase [Thalassotalea mangrovi]|uniref:MaoC family dehydratase n=2 Tax=Thalassotalea mangrovi TaxID=2572245 RepID=A0A4V5NUB4_9GAMM|nr:MaoC family dehydratase [Thalassotalea mangrovi]
MSPQDNYLATPSGLFFEDFTLDQELVHGVPRTITEGDSSLYVALTGSRFALNCAETVARAAGFYRTPVDNLLVFHIAFGKTVNDISLNAVANLGYAEVLFKTPVFAGDTLEVTSKVIGLKENSDGKTGIVYVHSVATNQYHQKVLCFKRWVMVHKKQGEVHLDTPIIPKMQAVIDNDEQLVPKNLDLKLWKEHYSDHQIKADDLNPGDILFHRDGITLNDSDHSMATRLYQNNARVHFDQHLMDNTAAGKRLVYGGHIISLCRALSYNGLGNGLWLGAIHGGTHANPSYAGDTIYCQSKILDVKQFNRRDDIALVRIQSLGIKNSMPDELPYLMREENGRKRYHDNLVLDLDYSVLMRR